MPHLSKEVLKSIWKEYVLEGRLQDHQQLAEERVRPEILRSWLRCMDYRVDPLTKTNTNVLDQASFASRLEINR